MFDSRLITYILTASTVLRFEKRILEWFYHLHNSTVGKGFILKTSVIPFDRYDWKRDSRLLSDEFSENVKQNRHFRINSNLFLNVNMLEEHKSKPSMAYQSPSSTLGSMYLRWEVIKRFFLQIGTRVVKTVQGRCI